MGTRLGITSSDGRNWHEQRSFVLRQLRNVGFGKTKMEEQIHAELNEILDIIKSKKDTPIWPGESSLISNNDDKTGDDVIYAYIKEMNAQKDREDTTFKLEQLVFIILDIFIAGASSTAITIDLALMSMLLYPEIQRKIHKEIDEVLGENSEMPRYIDRNRMPYTEAVLLEVQRMYSVASVSGPRRTMKATTLGGYDLPKYTTILIGLATVHKDEDYWKDPHNFRPERFLDENNKIYNTERVLPFGAGRRKCLGDQLARAALFTFFVGILKEFSLEKCESALPSTDLVPGLLTSPKPYKAYFRKRKI
ncbi:hypothetical protein PVAND_015167 [Polypedilum vanderplanki]|uniref:Cytochrome P450 n=1 Tax=Polypedilum vanderplanki TaxID=319348 RepID=A0A9J6BBG3_POLVA|nr:hypothetical protein PVAND_015167 [Polypedilum vanderplanki]